MCTYVTYVSGNTWDTVSTQHNKRYKKGLVPFRFFNAEMRHITMITTAY